MREAMTRGIYELTWYEKEAMDKKEIAETVKLIKSGKIKIEKWSANVPANV